MSHKLLTRQFAFLVLGTLAFAAACGSAGDDDDDGNTGGVTSSSGGGGGRSGTGGKASTGGKATQTTGGNGPNQCLSIATPVHGQTCPTNGLYCEGTAGPCLCQASGTTTTTGGRRGGGQHQTLAWNCFNVGTTGGTTGTGGTYTLEVTR